MRQWVESEPCGQLDLGLIVFPLPPASPLAALLLPLSLHTELCLYPITTLLRYGALARAPARFSDLGHLGAGGLGRGWALSSEPPAPV